MNTPPPRQPLIAWGIAAALGGTIAVCANRDIAGAGVGFLSLLALPFLFGVLGGVLRPDQPMRTSLILSVISLLVATPLLGEGVVCLVIVAPWHVVIAPSVGGTVGYGVRRFQARAAARTALVVAAFAGAASAPLGDAQLVDPDARETFADRVEVAAPRAEVWRSIEWLNIDFSTPAPWLLHAALPRPTGIRGGGADVGSERRAIFVNGVVLARVVAAEAPASFEVDLSVEESGREFFDHWAVLDHSRFALDTLPDGRTAITHVTTYRPLAYPRWYFAPIEHAMGAVVQRYMLEAYAAEMYPAVRTVAR